MSSPPRLVVVPPPVPVKAEPLVRETSPEAVRPISVPVLRPKLPCLQQLTPYLQAIDEKRLYSNGGPLSIALQAQLSRHLGCSEDRLITASSATSGITAALLALDLPQNSVCIMPSWTFAATPHAAMAAGLEPWFMDVEQRTWALDAGKVSKNMPPNTAAVIVVSPFGAPIDMTAWQSFQRKTGIAVIVDAAAGFDTVRPSSLISVVSLHATKIFAAGEGGLVIAPNSELRNRIRACSNFGFDGSRSAKYRAVNSKLSEYHAAVALANLENWPATRLRHLQIGAWYRQALRGLPHISLQPGYGDGWACGNTNILIESDSADSVARFMLREGIETRKWWGDGCHVQPAFHVCWHGPLPVTDHLGMHTLGLPHFVDMQKTDVSAVVKALAKALSSRARGRRKTIA
jgi:dTDP-4-amino-4,6-dideoxygalactose transaminase